jgi:tetratricopeptide (TPR) repeat protein
VRAGIAYLNKAISLDSTFSDAFNALGWCYWQLAEYAPDYSPDYYRQSREYLNKAIALDPQNGRAYSTLAVNQYHHDWDRKAASRSLKKAKELNPSDNEITMIHFWYYLHTQHCDSMKVMLGKMKEANPSDYYYHEVQLAICRGQDQELYAFNPPEDPSNWVGQFFEQQRLMILGKFDDALAKMELYKTLASEQIYLEMKGELLGMAGKKLEALKVIQQLEALSKTQHVWPSRFAIIYMAIGDEKKAYEYLEKGLAYRGLWLHFVPYYAPFYKKRNDPKFQAFMKRTWVN